MTDEDEVTEPGWKKIKTISSVENRALVESKLAELEIAKLKEQHANAVRDIARLTLAIKERDERIKMLGEEIERLRRKRK